MHFFCHKDIFAYSFTVNIDRSLIIIYADHQIRSSFPILLSIINYAYNNKNVQTFEQTQTGTELIFFG